jgi:hypothetical protein
MPLPSAKESRQAQELLSFYTPRGVIERAALRVLCVDCGHGGKTIVAVMYVRGRAFVAARAMDEWKEPEPPLGRHGRGWVPSWLDRSDPIVDARCDVRAYELPAEELVRRTPRAGKPRADPFCVSHTYPGNGVQ